MRKTDTAATNQSKALEQKKQNKNSSHWIIGRLQSSFIPFWCIHVDAVKYMGRSSDERYADWG